jgi:hypothetical protein
MVDHDGSKTAVDVDAVAIDCFLSLVVLSLASYPIASALLLAVY